MNVLILANNDIGLYSFRKEFLTRLIEDSCELFVSLPKGDRCKDIEKLGCRVINTNIDRRGMNPVKDFSLFRTYRKLLRNIKPDVVLTYTVKPNVYGGLACRLAHVPYISTVTGLGTSLENPGLLQKLVVFLYLLGLKKASAVMFQNSTNKELFERLHIGRNHRLVSGSGVNLEQHCFEPYPTEDTPVRLTFVGRIMRDKGINELLEAAKTIKATHPDVQFDLIGGFDEAFQPIVEEAEVNGIVHYLGVQSEMHRFYKDCWAVVMPSYHEGICNVCLEGASTGRPLLASNVPGCMETFDDGVSGIGFDAKSVSALTEAIEIFLALPYAQKAAMGAAGRKKMEQEFDREQVVQAYLYQIKEAGKETKK